MAWPNPMLLPGYVNGGGRAYGYDSLACLNGLTNPSDPTDWRVVAVLDGDRVHQGCCRGDTWRLHGLLVQHAAGWREHRFRRFARVAREFGYVGSFNGWDGFGFAVAGRRLPAAGNVGLLFRYDGVQRLSGLWHDHQTPLARPTDSLVFLESEDASGLAVAGFFDTWHSGSLDGLLASMMGRGQDTWPLPIELFGCLTTLAEHPDGNEGGAAGTPSVDRFIMGQASHARGNDRYPTRIAGAGGSQWSMAMSGPGCSSMDANRRFPSRASLRYGNYDPRRHRHRDDSRIHRCRQDECRGRRPAFRHQHRPVPRRQRQGGGAGPSADGATLKTWH